VKLSIKGDSQDVCDVVKTDFGAGLRELLVGGYKASVKRK